jgi:excisionase family DNA binding protein
MELLTVDELSELLRVSRNRVLIMVRRGEIPALRVLGRLRFSADEIDQWLNANRLVTPDQSNSRKQTP